MLDTSTAYQTEVDLPYGELNPLLDWCKRNCYGEWKFNFSQGELSHQSPFSPECKWRFYFESNRDYVAFLLFKK